MGDKMNADARIRMAIGDQFVMIQILQDQVEELTQQLADQMAQVAQRDAKIAEYEKVTSAQQPVA